MKFIKIIKAELMTKDNINRILQRNGFTKNEYGEYVYDGIGIDVLKTAGSDEFSIQIAWGDFPSSIKNDSRFNKMIDDINTNLNDIQSVDIDNLKNIISQVKNYIDKYTNKINNTEYDKKSFINVLNQEKKEVEELLQKFKKIDITKLFKDDELDSSYLEEIEYLYISLSSTLEDINDHLNDIDTYDNDWFEDAYKKLKRSNYIAFNTKNYKNAIKLLNKVTSF